MNKARRLFVLIARDASIAVIFLHAPDGRVRMIRWDLEDDGLHAGQWFTGTVHDLCSHLSPGGDYVIYFAERRKGNIPAWTAISRPPHFTALALWPFTPGNIGGGLFDDNNTVRLNHAPDQAELAKGFKLKPGMSVIPQTERSGELAFQEKILQRCGWAVSVPSGAHEKRTSGIFEKWSAGGACLIMQRRIEADWKGRRDYSVDYDMRLTSGEVWRIPEDVTWADWDRNGDLLFSSHGALYRLPAEELANGERKGRLLANFRDMEFEAIKPSRAALHWT